MRNRLFLRWFNGYEQRQNYCVETALIMDEGIENYIAIIVQRSNPKLTAILQAFESQVKLFRVNK